MTIFEATSAARRTIDEAARAAGRTDRVTLELAAKTRTPGECHEAAACLARLGGPVLVGHNRVQEARATAEAIRRVDGARIHLIGPLQTNKINQALACVDAVETLSSAELARKIDARATRPLPVFIQVNVSGEATKSGCAPDAVAPVIDAVSECANLRLAGFMTVGLNSPDEAPVRRAYARLRSIRDGRRRPVVGVVDGHEPRHGVGHCRGGDHRAPGDGGLRRPLRPITHTTAGITQHAAAHKGGIKPPSASSVS